ncbi:hypothetical protein DL96DRAFT_1702441 [Flagelloscypha sp. PMI_526]|nr:hypothetical protein DL96DRAFT_1702441 [Flagelloscypha sp. PMI_526]
MPQKQLARDRSWGTRFDALTTSPIVRQPAMPQQLPDILDNTKKRAAQNHDASIFVGSLPTNMEQHDLKVSLAEHLSEYAQFHNVTNVIRDSKGGVCAFIQCQDGKAAAELLSELNSSPPRPFHGRLLRFEPARALRTLLISYRKPTQANLNTGSDGQVASGDLVDLALPHTMRICRPHNAKIYSILYNSEAVELEKRARNEPGQPALPFSEDSIFLQPLCFDQQTIHALAKHFGRLEAFTIYPSSDTTDGNKCPTPSQDLPFPHNALRLPGMDTGCYEVKWAYRHDAVSALMTLRRVPHLTATWAHQPSHSNHESQSAQRDFHAGAAYPLHVEDTRISQPDLGDITSIQHKPTLQAATVRCDWAESQQTLHSPDWDEGDFPPLGNLKHGNKIAPGFWSEKIGDISTHSPELSQGRRTTDEHPTLTFIDQNPPEFDLPPTPGLGMSPVTPKTPGSQIPRTPPAVSGYHLVTDKVIEPNFENHDGERLLDPTTLFLGGLEMSGPGAWDEAKIHQIFSKYGSIVYIKLVKPPSAKAAFAFVQYDNMASPSHAIAQEHNRLHNGRALRVQLRDNNASRAPWKRPGPRMPFPRDSSLLLEDPGLSRRQETPTFSTTDCPLPRTGPQPNGLEGGAEAVVEANSSSEDALIERTELAKTASLPSTPEPFESKKDNHAYTSTETSTTDAATHSVTAPPSASTQTFPLPGTFYPVAPWVTPYSHAMTSSPFYPGCPPPGVTTPGSESTLVAHPPAPIATSYWPPHSMAYVPYPPPNAPTNADLTSLPVHIPHQAPLQPTGFIQDEHGALIPMYQPSALDHYMSLSQPTPASVPLTEGSPPTPPMQTPPAPIPTPIVMNWGAYPPQVMLSPPIIRPPFSHHGSWAAGPIIYPPPMTAVPLLPPASHDQFGSMPSRQPPYKRDHYGGSHKRPQPSQRVVHPQNPSRRGSQQGEWMSWHPAV